MKKYNVIMVLIDGGRIDRLVKSDDFTRVRKEGTFLSNMITASPYTLASLHSLFTSMYGSKNGVDGYYKLKGLREGCKTLAEYLQDAGYYTRVDQKTLFPCLERGYDITSEYIEEENIDRLTDRHTSIITKAIEEKNDRPFFLFLQYGLIHSMLVKNVFKKYDDFSEELFSKKEMNLKNYDAYIDEATHYMNRILSHLNDENVADDTILIFFSDHGTGIGEKRGERAYGIYTYDYSIRTFSIWINKELFLQDHEVPVLSETIDIMPTILHILGILSDRNSLTMMGESLLPMLKKGVKKVSFKGMKRRNKQFTYSETGGLNGPWPSPNEPNVRCIRTEDWKLIHNDTPNTWELYNLKKDPSESENVIEQYPRMGKKLRKLLTITLADCTVH